MAGSSLWALCITSEWVTVPLWVSFLGLAIIQINGVDHCKDICLSLLPFFSLFLSTWRVAFIETDVLRRGSRPDGSFCECPCPRGTVRTPLTGGMRKTEVRGESFFLENDLPGVFTSLQAPCFQPVGDLNPLIGLSYHQLALIYTAQTRGAWRENSSRVPLWARSAESGPRVAGRGPRRRWEKLQWGLTSRSFSKAPSPPRRVSQTNIKERKSNMSAEHWNNIWWFKKAPSWELQ